MFWQDLKIGFRKLAKKKTINALQIGGLAVGLAGFALVAQFVFWENSFDRDLPERERLFRIHAKIYREGALNLRSAMTYLDLAPSLKNDFSAEIESFSRLVLMSGQIKIEQKIFAEKRVCFTDAALPSFFDLKMIAGDGATALAEPGAAILSEKAALQFFGSVDCLGKNLEFESLFPQKIYVVKGVFRDQPANSHFSSRVYLSLKSLTETPGVLEKWAWRDFVSYVLLKKGASAAALEQKINRSDYVGAHWPDYPARSIRHELFLQNVADIHLGDPLDAEFAATANGKTVRNLGLIGLLLLLISSANFVLLALAKTAERGHEIGVRKTIGASQTGLLSQFFIENLPILSISVFFAGLLFWLAQPFFEAFVGEKMGFAFLKNGPLLASAAAVLFVVLGLACVAPAWAMARFQPIGLLRKNALVGSVWPQKGLVVFQFVLAFFMIASTLTVGRQVEFLLARDIGLRLEQTVVVTVPNDRSPEAALKIAHFKSKLLENPSIRSAAASMSVPGDGGPWGPSIRK